MARRYWVKRCKDDEEVIGTYFDDEGQASAVAAALEDETGQEYTVTLSPGASAQDDNENKSEVVERAEIVAERRLDERRERHFDRHGHF